MSAKRAKQKRRNVRPIRPTVTNRHQSSDNEQCPTCPGCVQEALSDGITLAHGYINYEVIEYKEQEASHQAAHRFAVEVREFVLGRMKEDPNITGEIAAMATLEQGHRFADIILDSQVKAAKRISERPSASRTLVN